MSASARREEGMRAAKVGWLAVTSGARRELGGLGRRIDKGPGQNRWIRGR